MKDKEMFRHLIEQAHEHILKAQAFIAPLIRTLNTKKMGMETESPSYKMYDADKIRLVKATLKATMELLDNDIPIERGNGWISVEERMPTKDALYLVHAVSLDLMRPFINTAWFNPDNDLGWENIPKVWSDAVSHWMPLPKAPLTMFKKPNHDDIHAIG